MSNRLQANDEGVSALVDGQLQGDEFLRVLDELDTRPGARQVWDDYQLVGQLLRGPARPLQTHSAAFVARLRQQMAQEPLLAPTQTPASLLPAPDVAQTASGNVVQLAPVSRVVAPAANDRWWRRVAGLASVALGAVLAWQGVGLIGGTDSQAPQLAQAPLAAPAAAGLTATSTLSTPPAAANLLAVDGTSVLMLRDPQLDALLAAHRQLGGATALQMPSGFLRNATFTEGQR